MNGGTGGGRYAYIGSFTSAGGTGITTAAVDPATGALTPLGSVSVLPDPSYLAAAPDGTVLYAVAELPGEGLAAAFTLRDPAAPAPLGGPVPTGGGAPTHLCLAGDGLFAANYESGSVGSVAVSAPDGRLEGLRGVLSHTGAGPDPKRQRGPHAHAVLPDPSGRFLVTADLGTDTLRVCEPVPGAAPRVRHETAMPPGSGPRHLVFHPDGEHAYCVNELDSTVSLLTWDAERGELRLRGSVRTVAGTEGAGEAAEGSGEGAVAAGEGAVGVRNYPSEAVVSSDGRFLWVANRGHDSIAVFALGADRLPVLTGAVPCGGCWPRDLAAHPVTGRLYAANERSGDVTWFDVDPADGMPRRAGSVVAPAASCVLFV